MVYGTAKQQKLSYNQLESRGREWGGKGNILFMFEYENRFVQFTALFYVYN